MKVGSREYRGEGDYQRVRELLIESYAITRKLYNWGLDRWDAWRFGAHAREEIQGIRRWEADVHLWETDAGKLVGVVNPEDRNDVFLQIHPHYRYLEEEMLDWAERHHQAIKPQDATSWPLNVFVYEYDQERASLLARRRYKDLGPAGCIRRCSLDKPIPEGRLPAGYAIRNLCGEDEADMEQQAAVTNKVFDTRFTAETIRVLQDAPTHRQDLDLAVVAPDGTFASFCTVWFDEANRIGTFEPVGTHPAHRRRGLAKAVMCEALRRLKALGTTMAYVGTGYNSPANHLYRSVGFTDSDVACHWQND
jgi:mycothiol synthase